MLLAADVLEHMPEPPCDTLQHIRRLLTPQGRFFTSVPPRLCRHDPGHFWTFLPEEWEQAILRQWIPHHPAADESPVLVWPAHTATPRHGV